MICWTFAEDAYMRDQNTDIRLLSLRVSSAVRVERERESVSEIEKLQTLLNNTVIVRSLPKIFHPKDHKIN